MGIKRWLTIGAGLVISAVYVIRRLQEESRSEAKVARIIREVDCKGEEPEETKSVDEMNDEIEQAFRDMDLNEEADAFEAAVDTFATQVEQEVKDATGKSVEEILTYAKLDDGETVKDWIDRNFEKMKEEADLEQIRSAVESKDFTQMYNLFEQRYNKYPVQMSRAEAFGKASDEGLISKDILKEAHERFGNLWFYVGD